jgi:hypothetical protein
LNVIGVLMFGLIKEWKIVECVGFEMNVKLYVYSIILTEIRI